MRYFQRLAYINLYRAFTWVIILSLVITAGPIPMALATTPATNNQQHSRTGTTAGTSKRHSPKPFTRPSLTELTKPVVRAAAFTNNPTDLEIFNSRIFFEPLVPMDDKVVPAENQALARALRAFKNRKDPENFSALTSFLSAHPKSRWRPALEANLGQQCFETGYLTNALEYWQSAWESSRFQMRPNRKAVADQAVSHLLMLEARLGLMNSLKKHLSELGRRTLTGSVDARVKIARDGLWSMTHHPEIAFKCGPFAVNTLAKLSPPQHPIEVWETIRTAASTNHGTNLAQLQDWSRQVGLKLQIAKRSTGAAIIVPALIHWKVGHFGAITAEENGRYRIEDPTFDEAGSLWVSKNAVESQSDGYFLVPAGKLLPGWRSVNREEAEKVWGKGMATTRDPSMTSFCPQQPLTSGGGGGGGGGGGPKPKPKCNGMASASAFSMNASLGIIDNPVGYTPPAGPDMQIEIKYNFNQGNQPGTFTFTNIGYDWNINWVSYLTVDGSNNVTVRVRGGGYEKYNFPYATTPNLTSQCLMANLGGGSYQRKWPDGTVENFTLSDGTNTYLTSVVDPQGNAATISYDANYRITGVSDACGNAATTFSYVSNTVGNVGFYKVASITDGFSRSASFAYDSTTTKLISITDAAGNVSQFFYDTSSTFISMLTTPYGSTSFYKYTPSGGGANPPVGLKVTYPDGSSAVIENWIGEQKATYYWDREATALYPTDPASHNYQHCKITRWLFASATNSEAPVGNWTRNPLESPVVTTYPGESVQNFVGTSNKPTQVARQWCGFRSTATITGTATPGNIVGIRVTDALFGPPETVQYTVQTGDTLSSIAAGLAAKINADVYISTFGISAAAASNVITFTSWSLNSTAYASAPVGSPTATITIAAGPNPAETATLGGSVTAGNVLTITVFDSGLSGGQQSVNYTVQAGDTLSTIAQELAMAINANTQLQSISVSAVWTGTNGVIGPIVSIKSDSPNTTTYTKSTSMGATTTITLAVTTNGIVQAWNYQRNTLGYMTQSFDPIGRQFNYTYAANNIDLLETRETKGTDNFLIGHWEYGNPSAAHRVTLYIDGSAQQTQYAYNTPFAELTTTTDANGNTTTRSYDSNGYLTQIDGPLSGSQDVTTFTFYGYGLVNTETDSEGYTRTYSYDDLNRRTSISYPDGTSEQTIYERLDAVMSSDRLGRWTQRSFNSMDQLVCETDPLGRKTRYCWCSCGSLASLTDPKNQTTSWHHDLEGRIIEKVYADQTSINYVYEPYSPRLQSMTDALSQVTHFVYNIDDTLMQKSYTNAVNATSPVTIAYDPIFPRTKRTTNGWGQIANSYNPYATTLTNKAYVWIGGYPQTPSATDTISITFTNSALSGGQYTMPTYSVLSGDAGQPALVATHLATAITSNSTLSAAGISATANGTMITVSAGSTVSVNPTSTGSTTATVGGGGRLAQVTNSVISNSPICYSFDALGRTSRQMINGGNNSTVWSFDAMSRITSEQNSLGTFNYAYVDDTPGSSKGTQRLASITYPNTQVANFSYFPNIGDQRLQQITNLGPTPSPPTLSQFNYAYNPVGEITQWLQTQNGTTTHLSPGYDLAGQLTAAPSDSGTTVNAYISGTPNAGDVVSVTAYDASLTGTTPPGQETASYTVQSGDTSADIASALASNIGTAMSNISVTASASSAVITINTSSNNATSFTAAVTGTGVTDTISLSASTPLQPLHNQLYYFYDQAGNRTSLQGNSTGSFPTGLTTSVSQYSHNNVNELTSISPGGAVKFQGTTVNPVKSVSINDTQTATVSGSSATPGDVVSLVVHDAALSAAEVVSYPVQTGDDFTAIAAGLTSAVNSDTTLQGIGVSATSTGAVVTISSTSANPTTYATTVNSGATETLTLDGSLSTRAELNWSKKFSGSPVLTVGGNTAAVTAVSGGGTAATTSYPITVSSGSTQTFTHDANGNMTSDGTNSYLWDAENRLIQVTYSGSGNNSQFAYDGLGMLVKIVETTGGSTTSTKQFVWCSEQMCEARDGSGNIVSQYFERGQTISGTSYFYTKDHLGSIREVANSSGAIQAQYSYDPYGQVTLLQGSNLADFQYAGYYLHQRSGLNLTHTRAYSSTYGRFINRDLIGEIGGTNLFNYVNGNPITRTDPAGTQVPNIPNPPSPGLQGYISNDPNQRDQGKANMPPTSASNPLAGKTIAPDQIRDPNSQPGSCQNYQTPKGELAPIGRWDTVPPPPGGQPSFTVPLGPRP
jgi:RHS repeat-associated protein